MEEERKKEIEERTKQLLVEKKNPVLFTSKDKSLNKKSAESINSISKRSDTGGKRTLSGSVRPSDDIFLKHTNKRRVDEGIPVIKNEKYDNTVVSAKRVEREEKVFPKVKLDKKENIFPEFPSLDGNGSFFDESEYNDLNEDKEKVGNGNWF